MKNAILIFILAISALLIFTACQGDMAGQAGQPYSAIENPRGGGGTGGSGSVPIINQTHMACVEEQCVEVQGVGEDECQIGACTENPNVRNETNTSNQTQNQSGNETPEFHRECSSTGFCFVVLGTGVDECLEDDDCQETNLTNTSQLSMINNQTNETHLICQNEECIEVEGEGTDECLEDAECVNETNTTNATHKTCFEGLCLETQGVGNDECDYNYECVQQNQTHKTCFEGLCLETQGEGADECTYNYQCLQVNQTHKICFEGLCIDTQGAGVNQCTYNYQCLQANNSNQSRTHKICQNGLCKVVQGAGSNECNYDYQCFTPPDVNQTDFYVIMTSLTPEEPILGQTVVLTYRYGNYGPDAGSAALRTQTYGPNGTISSESYPFEEFNAGQSETGELSILLDQGEGLYGFNLGIVPQEAENEQNFVNNNITVTFSVELGNCTQYNATICEKRMKCAVEYIDAADTDKCCSTECVNMNFWDILLAFFTGKL